MRCWHVATRTCWRFEVRTCSVQRPRYQGCRKGLPGKRRFSPIEGRRWDVPCILDRKVGISASEETSKSASIGNYRRRRAGMGVKSLIQDTVVSQLSSSVGEPPHRSQHRPIGKAPYPAISNSSPSLRQRSRVASLMRRRLASSRWLRWRISMAAFSCGLTEAHEGSRARVRIESTQISAFFSVGYHAQ